MILGLDAPDAGGALVDGRPYRRAPRAAAPGRRAARRDRAAPGPARLRPPAVAGASNDLPRGRVDEVLELVGPQRGRPPPRRRRSRSACASASASPRALLGDPPALMFDEPVNGLDPEGMRWIRVFLRSLAAEGRAVLVSSHLMSELQDTADHLVVIGRGRLIADASVERARRARLRATASPCGRPTRAPRWRCSRGPARRSTARRGDALEVSGLPAQRVAELMAAGGLRLHELTPHRASLEEAYMELTRRVESRPRRDDRASGRSGPSCGRCAAPRGRCWRLGLTVALSVFSARRRTPGGRARQQR